MKTIIALALFAVAGCLAGCGTDYDHTEVNAVVSSFAGASPNQADSVSENHITITEGHVVKAHIAVYNDDNKTMGLLVKSDDESTVKVEYVTTPDDFAFEAIKVGHTSVQLIADGTLVLTINADVLPQPTPSE